MNKYVKVNHYNNPFPKYLPINERSNGKKLLSNIFSAVIGFIAGWLFLWALSYTACMAQYHSPVCKQDLSSKLIFKLINYGSRQ